MKDEEVRPELWINPIDKHGEPVDATVMEIAKRAWPAVIAIGRERRMYDVSWLREIMEKVVHACLPEKPYGRLILGQPVSTRAG